MQQMMDVMDRLKEGGVLQVGILSQPAPPTR
jgi:biopolymer transport protein ExbD